jgi:hypothetical protein
VAYSRKFIINKDLNAEQLKRDYGIHIKWDKGYQLATLT